MVKEKLDVNYLVSKMLEFYDLLEKYIWDHSDKKFNIVINCNNNSLNTMFLFNDTLLDGFELRFSDKERKSYEYIVLFYMFKLFQNVYVYNDGNRIYNKTHKSYLSFIVEDRELFDKCMGLVNMINNYQDDEIYSLLESIYFEIKKKYRYIDDDTKMCVDHRIVLTKKLLKSDVYG